MTEKEATKPADLASTSEAQGDPNPTPLRENPQPLSPLRRTLYMFALIFAGEAIFALPFHLTRYFRPTFLDVFELSNLELGQAQAAYGVCAMLAYFPGGPLADRFSARALMITSLLTTALGGLYLLSGPAASDLPMLWAFWGLSTVLLFWAALIRATREWGGASEQGRAFGILDGGRGLFAALTAGGAVILFQQVLPSEGEISAAQRAAALDQLVIGYTLFTLIAALTVYLCIPKRPAAPPTSGESRLAGISFVLKRPTIWVQAFIVIAAYVGYKATDFYGQYAQDCYGLSETDAAALSTLSAWVRPFAALGAGFLADRLRATRIVSAAFLLIALIYGYMALATPDPSALWLLSVEIVLACAAIFGLRGIYFALFEVAALPASVTGAAVGVVSVIGYTPDIFMGPLSGWLLDSAPGLEGHQRLMGLVALFALGGAIAGLAYERLAARVVETPST